MAALAAGAGAGCACDTGRAGGGGGAGVGAAGASTGVEGVYAFLAWEKGSFTFTPGDPGQGKPLARSVEHLLLEGCRIIDESRQDPGDGAPLPPASV